MGVGRTNVGGGGGVKYASGSKTVVTSGNWSNAPITVTGISFKPVALVLNGYMPGSGYRTWGYIFNPDGSVYIRKESGGGVDGTSVLTQTADGFTGALVVYSSGVGVSIGISWYAIG